MGLFGKKESTKDELNRYIKDLEWKYRTVCPEVIAKIKDDVERDYHFSYNHGNAKMHLSKLVCYYGWKALNEHKELERINGVPVYIFEDGKYHESNGRLTQDGVELLRFCIEYTGLGVELGAVNEEQLNDYVFDFCSYNNLFDEDKARKRWREEQEAWEEEFKKDRVEQITKEYHLSGPLEMGDKTDIYLMAYDKEFSWNFLYEFEQYFLRYEKYGYKVYVVNLTRNETLCCFREEFDVIGEIRQHIPNEEHNIELLGTGDKTGEIIVKG